MHCVFSFFSVSHGQFHSNELSQSPFQNMLKCFQKAAKWNLFFCYSELLATTPYGNRRKLLSLKTCSCKTVPLLLVRWREQAVHFDAGISSFLLRGSETSARQMSLFSSVSLASLRVWWSNSCAALGLNPAVWFHSRLDYPPRATWMKPWGWSPTLATAIYAGMCLDPPKSITRANHCGCEEQDN